MKKESAVEWLYERFLFAGYAIPSEWKEKAKEMEEGQIALAYSKGTLDGVNKDFTNGYTYYKKTYK
jgi:hypothetical protein